MTRRATIASRRSDCEAADGRAIGGAPPEAAWLVRLLGEADALRLVEAHGGVRISIPHRAEGSALAGSIGLRAAGLLAAELGGNFLRVPLCKRWQAIALRERDGLSYSEIARRLLASESSVFRWLESAGMTASTSGPQMDLPGL